MKRWLVLLLQSAVWAILHIDCSPPIDGLASLPEFGLPRVFATTFISSQNGEVLVYNRYLINPAAPDSQIPNIIVIFAKPLVQLTVSVGFDPAFLGMPSSRLRACMIAAAILPFVRGGHEMQRN